MASRRATEPVRQRLPPGVALYRLGTDGRVTVDDEAGRRELDPAAATDAFQRFVDDGQWAHYLLGGAGTSPDRPHNATVKLGIIRPRSAFTPHAHGGEHLVLSLGYASCGLYDAASGTVVDVALTPGKMIRIPSLLPHAFGNRAAVPLVIVAANTGYGIDHPDYAVTAAEAGRRAAAAAGRLASVRLASSQLAAASAAVTTRSTADIDYEDLAGQLRLIEHRQRAAPAGREMTGRERLAAWLRRGAARLEADRRGEAP